MQQPMQPILQHLFQASSLDDISRQRLEAFVEEYPSFGIGHYLLSRKLMAEDSERFAADIQKTSLYFTNPFWLQWQLDNAGFVGGRPERMGAGDGHADGLVAEASPENGNGGQPAWELPEGDDLAEALTASQADALTARHEEALHSREHAVNVEGEVLTGGNPGLNAEGEVVHAGEASLNAEGELLHGGAPALNTGEKASVGRAEEEWSPEEIGRATAGEGESVEGDIAAVKEPAGKEGSSAAEELLLRIEEARGLRETMQKINHDYDAGAGAGGEEAAAVQEGQPGVQEEQSGVREEAPLMIEEVTAVQEEAPVTIEEAAAMQEDAATLQEEPIHDEEAPFVLDEEEEKPQPQAAEQAGPAIEMQPDAGSGADATVPVHIDAIPATDTSVPANTDAGSGTEATVQSQPDPTPQAPQAEPALVFEPYHTIDYFASQGIKLTLDENPTDPLGKQLKSFTAWLKSMRRLPQKDREVIPDRVAEQAVQNFAAHSIEGKEVVTETMAEVLEMQGMRERAKAVYEKLSLLNPDKRAYFAAKIEKLNIL